MLLFSIIIPTYNRQEKLLNTLKLLTKQLYKNFEVIVVEDVYDNTFLIKPLRQKLNINYISFFERKNVSIKRNIGAKNAKGKYLIFLDDDDIVSEKWMLTFSAVLENRNDDIAFCAVQSGAKIIYPEKAYTSDEREWGIFLAGAFAVKKELFEAVKGYDEILRYGENTELGLRLKQVIQTKQFINEVGLIYQPSKNGGLKKIENTFIANNHILDKHKDWFNNNPILHFNYLSVLGVASFKLKKMKLAKHYFKKALSLKLYNPIAWFRFVLAQFPFIASKVWRTK
ncbi:MAG: glycosyltransferase family A protein [Bacteroidetes bacterium]|nr:glycosyltransferase family A protein [Bacteroidota bacterium]